MVKALHGAGIEVILDVVYNHTAEGNHLGPMLSFKGVDNLSYYRTVPGDARHYMDYTGTGNSLNPVHPSVLRLIMDSLRYFVIEGHVDGFRFDLASALAREFHEVDRLSAFFDIIHQDPILSAVKLIAEPWDVGEGGYQVGNFPVLWTEWNGIYRDTMRDFWRGQAPVSEFASRFTGSSDLYQHDGRRPFASINFITAHDGFTLRDLVTYNEKHNEANLESNQDGDNHNRSWNHGVEGETDDEAINVLRERQQRNFLTTLFLSQGVPMLLGGDELARTQQGQQQRLLPGQRDLLDQLAARRARAAAARVDEAADRAAHAASGLPPRRLPHRRGAARLGRARRLVVPGGRTQDDAAELARRQRAHARRLPQRLRDPDPDRARRPGDRRHLPDPVQRLGGRRRLHAPGRLVRAPLGARALDDASPRPRRARRHTGRGRSSRWRAARSSCFAGSASARATGTIHNRDQRRATCPYRCSTCRCHSTGTSPGPTTNRATPAATASAGCTIGSSLRKGRSSVPRGRPESWSTRSTRAARCWWVGVPWSRPITGAGTITAGVSRSSCPATGRPARPSRTTHS